MTTYTPWNTLQSSLASRPLPAKYQRWANIYFALLFIIGLAAFGFGCWVLWQAVNHGWQTGHWRRLSHGSLVFAVGFELLLLPLLGLAGLEWRKRIFVSPAPLRTLMATGHEKFLPLAKEQPEAFPPDERPAGLHQLEALMITHIPLMAGWAGPLAGLGIIGFFLPMTFANLLNNVPSALGIMLSYSQEDILTFTTLALTVCPFGLLGIGTAIWSLRWRSSFTVGEDGIHWRNKGFRTREHYVPWSQAQAFCFNTTIEQFIQRTTFLLDMGESGIFSWECSSHQYLSSQREARMLERMIVTYTNLSLRDLSPVAHAINHNKGNPQKLHAAGLPENIVALAAKKPFPRQFLWIGGVLLLVFVLLLGELFWAVFILPN